MILGGVCVAGGISGDLGISFVVPNGFWDVASVFFASTFVVGALGGPPIDLGAFGPPPP